MIKGKKAQLIAILLVIVTLIAMVMALNFFFKYRARVSDSLEPPSELVEAISEKKIIEFYADDAGRLSAGKAFFNIAEKGASSGQCSLFGEYIIWSENCKPDAKEMFLNEFNKTFSELISDYTLHNIPYSNFYLNDSLLTAESKDITLEASNEKGYVNYNATLSFNASLNIDMKELGINLDDFSKIYNKAMECKDKNITKVTGCMKVEGWNTNSEISGSYLLFDMSTDKSFLVDSKFVPVTLSFALTI